MLRRSSDEFYYDMPPTPKGKRPLTPPMKKRNTRSASPSASPLSSSPSSSHEQTHSHHCLLHSHSRCHCRRDADISRLLDPAYTKRASSAAAAARAADRRSPSTVHAYVDTHGNMHDPDYRHFPPLSSSPTRSAYHHHNTRRGASPRPQFDWEIDLDSAESALLDDEDAQVDVNSNRLQHQASGTLSTNYGFSTRYSTPSYGGGYGGYASRSSWGAYREQHTRPRESSFSTAASAATGSNSMYSPTGTASTLPTSYEDDSAAVAAAADSSPFEHEKKEKRRRLSKADKERARVEKEKEREREREQEQEEQHDRRERRRRSTGDYNLSYNPLTTSTTTSTHHFVHRRSIEGMTVSLNDTPIRHHPSFSRTRGTRRTRMIHQEDDISRSYGHIQIDNDDEEDNEADREEEEEEDDSTQLRRRTLRLTGLPGYINEKEARRRAASSGGRSWFSGLMRSGSEKEKDNDYEGDEEREKEKENEYVPTCGESLRRRWQALALSVRFGVFRAQRRVMRRVASVRN